MPAGEAEARETAIELSEVGKCGIMKRRTVPVKWFISKPRIQ